MQAVTTKKDKAPGPIPAGALEGDALTEGDAYALGAYQSMLKLRSDEDIQEEAFPSYLEFRKEAIETPDEIWRRDESEAQTLLVFIKDFSSRSDSPLWYISVTQESGDDSSYCLLFSFPTNDTSLVSRYQAGENLKVDEGYPPYNN